MEGAVSRGLRAARNPGFDCVIGNPPWERMKLQEREFFAFPRPNRRRRQRRHVAASYRTAWRRPIPTLFAHTLRPADGRTTLGLRSRRGQLPADGQGDVNTYMVFAELARGLSPRGRVGLLVPSGIATDHTTRDFFGELLESNRCQAIRFREQGPVFPGRASVVQVQRAVFRRGRCKTPAADFAFFLHRRGRPGGPQAAHSALGQGHGAAQPNTRTCPVFRTRRDAELTKAIYRTRAGLSTITARKAATPGAFGSSDVRPDQ